MHKKQKTSFRCLVHLSVRCTLQAHTHTHSHQLFQYPIFHFEFQSFEIPALFRTENRSRRWTLIVHARISMCVCVRTVQLHRFHRWTLHFTYWIPSGSGRLIGRVCISNGFDMPSSTCNSTAAPTPPHTHNTSQITNAIVKICAHSFTSDLQARNSVLLYRCSIRVWCRHGFKQRNYDEKS